MKRLILSAEAFDVRDRLTKITAKTLIVVGGDGLPDARSTTSEYLFDHIAGSDWIKLPVAGHASMYEKPLLFVSLVKGYLNVGQTDRIHDLRRTSHEPLEPSTSSKWRNDPLLSKQGSGEKRLGPDPRQSLAFRLLRTASSKRLPAHVRVIAPDLRGFGESSYVNRFDSLLELAEDIKMLLDATWHPTSPCRRLVAGRRRRDGTRGDLSETRPSH
ncbi:MAG: hypothetical protein MZU97_24315 [Bacillus subtilis]|nr:hypothetical protein [Bacillus subtilis]